MDTKKRPWSASAPRRLSGVSASVTTAPRPTTVASTTEPSTTLHMVHENDILRGQVYGIPAVAICGFKFVPASGSATSGGGRSTVCTNCDLLWKMGVRTAPTPG